MTRASSPPPPTDEISLRDLYLVVRRSALAIAGFTLLVAALVAVVTISRPPTYRAEATTAVSRPPISVQQEFGLAFRPELDVTYETYQTLAFSRGVIERTLDAVPAVDVGSGAQESFALERLAGSATQPSSLLAVAHRVGHGDPQVAADLASTWATMTIETVRTLLDENLDAIDRITTDAVAEAAGRLERAEAALLELREGQAARSDPLALASAQVRLFDLEMRVDDITRRIDGGEAEAASLRARADDADDEMVVLRDAPDVALSLAGALWATEARLASLRAELEAVVSQRDALRERIAELTPSVARYGTDLARRTREVEGAERAFDALVDIEPTVAYVAQLAPTGARLLGEAAVPARAEPRRAAITTVLAAVAAAFVALVVVLLREAVRDPGAGTASARRVGETHTG